MRKIVWSDYAKQDFAQILEFLKETFGSQTVLTFIERTDRVIDQIETFPFSYPISDKNPQLRKAVLNKNVSLIYRISKKQIELVFFWDNRMKDLQ
ncbi:MAG: type II toxin-antitoxin system RelE/ParE family toxin [Saprospiraceae bacterium]